MMAPAQATAQETDVVRLLQDLIQIDSTNPPGNEIAVANYLQEYLTQRGIESKVIESAPGRGNIIARIKGSGTKEPLVLLSHLDVVPASPEEWDLPPFAGRIEEGAVWGRGAIDMKGMIAMEVTAFLKAADLKLEGDLIYVGAADEEAGGEYGARFLVEKFWDEVRGGYVLNEGSIGVEQDGRAVYPIQVAEKGVLWLKLTVEGTSGHGSMPGADNPVALLTSALHRIHRYQAPLQITPVAREFLKRVGPALPFWQQRLVARLLTIPRVARWLDPFIRGSLRKNPRLFAMLANTMTTTVLEAGYKVNVVPNKATASLDVRILPGETKEKTLELLGQLAGPKVMIEVLGESSPSGSDWHDPFYAVIESTLKEANREAIVSPYLSPGATDSRFFREKGVTSYGIIPIVVTPEELNGLHGKNERVPIHELERGTDLIYEIIQRILEPIPKL